MVQAVWFLLGLGLGLALDFLLVKVMLRSIQERLSDLERANWLARDSKLAQAHSLAMLKVKDSGLVQTELDLESNLARESARQEREKANWKVQG
jgi:hypothetical protein